MVSARALILLSAVGLMASAPRIAFADVVSDAAAAYKAGRMVQASALFHEAYRETNEPDLLFNSARALQRAALSESGPRQRAHLTLARERYLTYVGLAEASAKGRKRASVHIKEVEQVLALLDRGAPIAETPADPAATTPSVVAQPAPDLAAPTDARPAATTDAVTTAKAPPAGEGSWHKPTALTTGGVGLTLGGVATWLGLASVGEQADLDGQISDGAIDYDSYKDKQRAIWDKRDRAVLLGSLGAACVGAAVVIWAIAPDDKPARSATAAASRGSGRLRAPTRAPERAPTRWTVVPGGVHVAF